MEFRQFSLRQAGEYDKMNGAKGRLTGWGMICKEREKKGISRRLRRLQKEQAKKEKDNG